MRRISRKLNVLVSANELSRGNGPARIAPPSGVRAFRTVGILPPLPHFPEFLHEQHYPRQPAGPSRSRLPPLRRSLPSRPPPPPRPFRPPRLSRRPRPPLPPRRSRQRQPFRPPAPFRPNPPLRPWAPRPSPSTSSTPARIAAVHAVRPRQRYPPRTRAKSGHLLQLSAASMSPAVFATAGLFLNRDAGLDARLGQCGHDSCLCHRTRRSCRRRHDASSAIIGRSAPNGSLVEPGKHIGVPVSASCGLAGC